MATTAAPSSSVVVIGAGIIGLSAATKLQEQRPEVNVTIVAAETPSLPVNWTKSSRPSADYASMWAGAHFRPIPRSTRQLEEEADMAFETRKVMYRIIEQNPEAGVAKTPAVEYLEDPPPAISALRNGDAYAGPGDGFKILDQHELPEGVKFGCSYEAYCVNIHVYCSWLLKNFLAKGGRLVQRRLESVEEVFDQDDIKSGPIVVNCSGRNFDLDPKTQIIRGHTVLVKNQYHSTITRQNSDGSWVFTVPRPLNGGTVIGGTKEIGDEETEPRAATREKLLEDAVRCFPDFVDDVSKFEVLMDNVGRRPWREGGLRIETEQLPGARTVIHGYGAGGRGYELSWGVAERIAHLYAAATEGLNGHV